MSQKSTCPLYDCPTPLTTDTVFFHITGLAITHAICD